jgi:hypothetical protein
MEAQDIAFGEERFGFPQPRSQPLARVPADPLLPLATTKVNGFLEHVGR